MSGWVRVWSLTDSHVMDNDVLTAAPQTNHAEFHLQTAGVCSHDSWRDVQD